MSLRSGLNWNDIGQELSKVFRKIHSKQNSMSASERLQLTAKWMKEMIQEVHTADHAMIQQYMEMRKPYDTELKRIEKAVQRDIASFLKEEVISASSFSAGTNLVGDSDLDFNVPISPMDTLNLVRLSNLCGQNGYEFAEIRNVESPNLHYVFQKVVEGVERVLNDITVGEYRTCGYDFVGFTRRTHLVLPSHATPPCGATPEKWWCPRTRAGSCTAVRRLWQCSLGTHARCGLQMCGPVLRHKRRG